MYIKQIRSLQNEMAEAKTGANNDYRDIDTEQPHWKYRNRQLVEIIKH